jgi:hypothetical protein
MTAEHVVHSAGVAPTPAAIRLAGLGLPTIHAMPESPVADAEWDRLTGLAVEERLTGLLHWAVWHGVLPSSARQVEQIFDLHLPAAAHVVRLEQDLVTVSSALASEDIPHRVLKGPAVARLDYPDPGMRTFEDIDLLVPHQEFKRAVSALGLVGYHRLTPPSQRGAVRQLASSVTLVSESQLEVDLHRGLFVGPAEITPVADDIWSESEPIRVGAAQLHALSREQRLLAAAHAVVAPDRQVRLSRLRDLAQMLLSPALEPERLIQVAETWGALFVLRRAIALTWAGLRLADEAVAHPLLGAAQ